MAEAVLSGGKSTMRDKGTKRKGGVVPREGEWTKSTLKLILDGTWSIEESSGYQHGRDRGDSRSSGSGTWALNEERTSLALTVSAFESSNSDARAPEPEEVGKTYLLDLAALRAGTAISPFFKIEAGVINTGASCARGLVGSTACQSKGPKRPH